MGKQVTVKDTIYKIEYDRPNYYLYKQVGKWFNKKWHRLYFTDNKTKFIQQMNRYFV